MFAQGMYGEVWTVGNGSLVNRDGAVVVWWHFSAAGARLTGALAAWLLVWLL
jgi:hypothetical protein